MLRLGSTSKKLWITSHTGTHFEGRNGKLPIVLAKHLFRHYGKFSVGQQLMPTYRLYRLDKAGKFAAGEALEAPDDDEAMKIARATGHAFACEVWLARRLIGRIVAR